MYELRNLGWTSIYAILFEDLECALNGIMKRCMQII
jgi:hypothetical protein